MGSMFDCCTKVLKALSPLKKEVIGIITQEAEKELEELTKLGLDDLTSIVNKNLNIKTL